MLAYLLDQNISDAVEGQVRAKRPDIPIESVQRWRGGALLGTQDGPILAAAREAGLTLVTYDVSTIVPLLAEFGRTGTPHAGVLFIDHRTMASHNFGALVRALIAHWDARATEDWANRADYLRAAG